MARQIRGWLSFAAVFIVFPLLAHAESLGDPFEGNSLKNPNWKWQNEPAKWDVGATKSGWLHIVGERNRNLWDADSTNRLFQERRGDFDVETHLMMDYKDVCTVMGLVALSPTTKDRKARDGEWVTLKLWGRGPADGNNAVIQFQKREFDAGEGLLGIVPGFQDPVGAMDIYMRLRRKGNTYTAFWKRESADNWTEISKTDHDLKEPLQVGIYSGICGAAGQMSSQYEYFEDLQEPFLAVSPGGKLPVTWSDLKSRVE